MFVLTAVARAVGDSPRPHRVHKRTRNNPKRQEPLRGVGPDNDEVPGSNPGRPTSTATLRGPGERNTAVADVRSGARDSGTEEGTVKDGSLLSRSLSGCQAARTAQFSTGVDKLSTRDRPCKTDPNRPAQPVMGGASDTPTRRVGRQVPLHVRPLPRLRGSARRSPRFASCWSRRPQRRT
jgi:hypothetical protein